MVNKHSLSSFYDKPSIGSSSHLCVIRVVMATITNGHINRKLEGSNSGYAVMDYALTGFVNIHRADLTTGARDRVGKLWAQHLSLPQNSLIPVCHSCKVALRMTSWPVVSMSSAKPQVPFLSQHLVLFACVYPGIGWSISPPHLSPPRDKQCAPLPCSVGAKFCQPCPHFLPSRAPGGRKQYRLHISGKRRPKLQPEIKKPRPSVNWAQPTRTSLRRVGGGRLPEEVQGMVLSKGRKVQGPVGSPRLVLTSAWTLVVTITLGTAGTQGQWGY